MNTISFQEYYQEKFDYFEQYLKTSLPQTLKEIKLLKESSSYSLLAGGKRIRPILMLTTMECLGTEINNALSFAAAIEYIHTYSLIHDDLPCMDNDDLRRGLPTNHIKFGEDIAVLTGDGLLTHAFQMISSPSLLKFYSANTILQIIHILSNAAGFKGMVAGQVLDIKHTKNKHNQHNILEIIYAYKTGALISSALEVGAVLSNTNNQNKEKLKKFGFIIGKCFQIHDDILDETTKKEVLGKTPGSDKKNDKATFVSIYGLDKAKELAHKHYVDSIKCLREVDGNTSRLEEFAEFFITRKY